MLKKRQIFEIGIGLVVLLMLIGIGRLETRLLELSRNLSVSREFLSSVIYFGFINLNVVFILVLSFLIFRNLVKLLLDRKRGVIGSGIRTKLLLTVSVFAGAPTLLMFYISYWFVTQSFDTWFSARVKNTMQQTREAGAEVYEKDQLRLESLARIALQRVSVSSTKEAMFSDYKINTSLLSGFAKEYKIDDVLVYDKNGDLIYPDELSVDNDKSFATSAIVQFQNEPTLVSRVSVEVDHDKDVVKGVAPILVNKKLVGVVITEERFETQILKSIETILNEFASLKPGAQMHRIGYLGLLIVTVMVIAFATIWLGFYVTRAITEPLIKLSDATRKIAKGEYDIKIEAEAKDETGALIDAFNLMADDLRTHEEENKSVLKKLRESNDELLQRRQYMEVVLRNITAGVISIDADSNITSFNDAAERLLDKTARLGVSVKDALGEELYQEFWKNLEEGLKRDGSFGGQVNRDEGQVLVVEGVSLFDENEKNIGAVVVFDDASEQVKVQRVAAWREVARRIAHEIKNPITPIRLSAQRLLRRYGDSFKGEDREVFESCIETILGQVDSLKNLVNEFSKFTRLPTVQTKLEDVNEIVTEAVRFYGMSYPDIDFSIAGLDPDLPKVKIDREQFNRAIYNIIQNAIAALQDIEDQKISILSARDGTLNAVRIDIIDNGSGIPQKVRARVFEPYFSTKKEGTGLGLAIVNQIISDHGGYIRIGDVSPRGTKITIELPIS